MIENKLNIQKINFKEQISANNAFIGAQIKFDEVIEKLRFIRKNMEGCKNWAHAEGLCYDVNKLVEATNEMTYLIKK